MLVNTRAIVLNTLKYGESQVIADLLTEEYGRLSFIISVTRSRRSVRKTPMLQPLTILSVCFDHRPQRRLGRIKEATVAFPAVSIPFDARKLSIALFIAEFTSYATRSEQRDDSLYAFVENSIRWLDACQGDFANFHIVYMLHLTRFVGFFPNLYDAQDDACFDMRGGCFVDNAPPHPDFLPPHEASKIKLLMRLSYATMHLLAISRQERGRILDVILTYYRLHQPDFPEMQSLPVLRTLFV